MHFKNHPEDLEELISLAKRLENPHAKITGGVDLQVPAIMQFLEKNNLSLQGKEVVEIGDQKNNWILVNMIYNFRI